MIPAGNPQNILGSRWLGLDKEGYGIHGTTEPQSLGKQATAGCVRMQNSEVEQLYSIVPKGTEVTIVD
jgi:lipoprotein-anchoring transpeptidase ErfK/SrfK